MVSMQRDVDLFQTIRLTEDRFLYFLFEVCLIAEPGHFLLVDFIKFIL